MANIESTKRVTVTPTHTNAVHLFRTVVLRLHAHNLAEQTSVNRSIRLALRPFLTRENKVRERGMSTRRAITKLSRRQQMAVTGIIRIYFPSMPPMPNSGAIARMVVA